MLLICGNGCIMKKLNGIQKESQILNCLQIKKCETE